MDMLLDWISPELVAKQVGWNATNVVITNKEIAGIGSLDACWWYSPLPQPDILAFSLSLSCLCYSVFTADSDSQMPPSQLIGI